MQAQETKTGQFAELLSNVSRRQILADLNEMTSPFNTAIFCLDHEIDFLREYRRRLAADVVTGKLAVTRDFGPRHGRGTRR